jgi:hypothetical protein
VLASAALRFLVFLGGGIGYVPRRYANDELRDEALARITVG